MASSLILSVPARPEALAVVRLVLMSRGAVAGIDIDAIFTRSRRVAEAFTDALLLRPEASSIVIRLNDEVDAVDMVPTRIAGAGR